MEQGKIVFFSLCWRFAEAFGAQLIQLIVTLILARILSPEIFGTVTFVLIFSQIVQVFVDSGFGSALVQELDADEEDFSSVFYFNIIMCLLMYLLIFFCAPYIAVLCEDITLIPVIRFLGLVIIISGFKNIQQAYVYRTMQFKKFFFSTLAGTIISAVIGVWMAAAGYGIWALAVQKVLNAFIDTAVLWIVVKWKPGRSFSIERLKHLVKYGWKLLVSSLVDTLYNNLRQFIIGNKYSEADLAYYDRGNQIPNLIVSNINTSIDSVIFPVLSKSQTDKEKLKYMTKKAICTSAYILAPLMIGMAFLAPSFVEVVLTEKWLPCVPYLQMFCFTYLLYPLQTANLNVIKAVGRSDIFLKLEMKKKITGLAILGISMWFGVKAIAYSYLLNCCISLYINCAPNKKILNYSMGEQMMDFIPYVLLSVVMGIGINFLRLLHINTVWLLFLQIILGIVIYVSGSVLLKFDTFYYLLSILKAKRNS